MLRDATSGLKVAAGFTNSGAKAGDKMHTLTSLAVFAAQHHMHWINLGLGAGWNSSTGSENDLNRLGFWLGAGGQTDVDAGAEAYVLEGVFLNQEGVEVATLFRHPTVASLAEFATGGIAVVAPDGADEAARRLRAGAAEQRRRRAILAEQHHG